MTLTRETVEKLMSDATPGPWEVMKPTDWIMAGMMHVAQVRGYGWLTGHGGDGPKLSDAEATQVQTGNARLIASTPDLAAALLAAWADRDALDKAYYETITHCEQWIASAEAAEANVARLESHIEATAKDTHKLLIAAEAEIAELKLDATARDVRIFELREELDNAEAKLAERDAENAQLRGNITILLHTWRIGDLQDHDFTAALNKEPKP